MNSPNPAPKGPLPNHGTKILGIVITALGALVALSPDTLNQLFGHYANGVAVFAGGLLTIARGFQNSSNNGGGS